MTEMKQKTAWMWLSGQDLRGLSWDRGDDTLTWIWQAGCHCADEDEISQTRKDFLRDGAPPLIGTLPRDIADEIEATLVNKARYLRPSVVQSTSKGQT